MARIVCLGEAAQNVYLIERKDALSAHIGEKSVFHNPKFGSQLSVDDILYQVGGSAANAATAFARYGHEAILFTNIAHDAAGDAIMSALDDESIDSSYVHFVSSGQTSCKTMLLDASRGNSVDIVYQRSGEHFENLSAKDLQLIHPDWVYLSSANGNFELLDSICDKAHQLKAKVVFNPGPAELANKTQLVQLLAKIDILVVNKKEAAKIVNGDNLDELLARLRRHVKTVIITAGIMGGIAGNDQQTVRFGIYSSAKVLDRNGVGDAFGAGFLAHFSEHGDFKEALIFASANATSVVSQIGAQTGLLTGEEQLHPMPIQDL